MPTMMKNKADPWHFARPGLATKYLQTFEIGLISASPWRKRVAKHKGWSAGDQLCGEHEDPRRKVTVLSSKHTRTDHHGDIELRHLWIQMN